eukprot:COSAG05_NODE_1164_length_5652_cov_6.810733_3_plen_96_part_00
MAAAVAAVLAASGPAVQAASGPTVVFGVSTQSVPTVDHVSTRRVDRSIPTVDIEFGSARYSAWCALRAASHQQLPVPAGLYRYRTDRPVLQCSYR